MYGASADRRVCRKWSDVYTLDSVAVKEAEAILRTGMARFPNDAFMALTLANFQVGLVSPAWLVQPSRSGRAKPRSASQAAAGHACGAFCMCGRPLAAEQLCETNRPALLRS